MRIDRPKQTLEAVGLTPLIDMIFLLLLFFLLEPQPTADERIS